MKGRKICISRELKGETEKRFDTQHVQGFQSEEQQAQREARVSAIDRPVTQCEACVKHVVLGPELLVS